jgi:hypothetical protein
MDRREFTHRLALVALAASGAVSAQPVRKVYRIGILGVGTTSDMVGPQPSSPSVKALLGVVPVANRRGVGYGRTVSGGGATVMTAIA